MKKSIIAFCAAASFAVLPTVSHAAQTSNEGHFERGIYMKCFMPQFELKFMQNSEQTVVVKKHLFVDKKKANKPSTVEKEAKVSTPKEQPVVEKKKVVKQPVTVEKEEAVKESTKEQPTTTKEQASPVVVEKEQVVKQPVTVEKEEVVKEPTKEQPIPTKEQASPAVVEKEESIKQPTTEQPESNDDSVENPAQVTAQQTNESKPAQQSLSEVDQIEAAVVQLTNNERAKAGLAPLEMDNALMAAAREKSQDMKVNNYFSHTSPTFGSPFDRLKALGISYQAAGENIAKGQRTAEEVVTAWMNSEGHRANILDGKFTHIGVGFVKDGSIWTQQFIKK
ncbi:MAG: CAP domain-containing protein [Solibacillus sp.]